MEPLVILAIPPNAYQNTLTSGPVTVPVGYREVDLSLAINPLDGADPTKTATFTVERSHDGGATYTLLAQSTWSGDPAFDGSPVILSVGLGSSIGQLVRCSLNMPLAVTMSGTMSLS